MHIELPILSFTLAALVATSLVIRRVREDIAALSFVSWLFICNFVHGINAVSWAGNSHLHALVWCDIATKLVLGTMIALPASCLCIMRKSEFFASSRPFPSMSRARTWIIIDLVSCVVVPILYMLMHLFFQGHRFDLLQDYGCSASVYPATISVVFMWLPPLVCCIAVFVFCGVISHHSCGTTAPEFSQHVCSRSSMKPLRFFHRLAVTILMSSILFMIVLFSMFTGVTKAKVSWALIHANFHVVQVITSGTVSLRIKLTWWSLRILSLIYILLVFTLEEGRDVLQSVKSWWPKLAKSSTRIFFKSRPSSAHGSLLTPRTTPRPHTITLDLKSGWDDMWESKSVLRSLFSPISPTSPRAKTPISFRSTPSPSPVRTDEDVFLASALSNLGLPMAHGQGPSAPVVPPLHIPSHKIPSQSSPIQWLPSATVPEAPRMSRVSTISSLFEAHWPQPPDSPCVSPAPSPSCVVSPHSVSPCSKHVRDESMSAMAHEVSVEHADMLTVPATPVHSSLRSTTGENRFSTQGDIIYETEL
ncbi:hypothetical protein AX15_003495 [Amanita polypyramis BW_CC]|nr:hypothetical protein AX15_003495 [Amanita polypyramis BW_CC]